MVALSLMYSRICWKLLQIKLYLFRLARYTSVSKGSASEIFLYSCDVPDSYTLWGTPNYLGGITLWIPYALPLCVVPQPPKGRQIFYCIEQILEASHLWRVSMSLFLLNFKIFFTLLSIKVLCTLKLCSLLHSPCCIVGPTSYVLPEVDLIW